MNQPNMITLAQLVYADSRDAELDVFGLKVKVRLRNHPTSGPEIAARKRLAAAIEEAKAWKPRPEGENETDAALARTLDAMQAELAVDPRLITLENVVSWLVSWDLAGADGATLPLEADALYALSEPTGVYEAILAAILDRIQTDGLQAPASDTAPNGRKRIKSRKRATARPAQAA